MEISCIFKNRSVSIISPLGRYIHNLLSSRKYIEVTMINIISLTTIPKQQELLYSLTNITLSL